MGQPFMLASGRMGLGRWRRWTWQILFVAKFKSVREVKLPAQRAGLLKIA